MKKILKYAVLPVLVLVGLLTTLLSCESFGTRPSTEDQYRFESSSHYDKTKAEFVNRRPDILDAMNKRFSFKDSLKFVFSPAGNREPSKKFPEVKPKFAEFMIDNSKIKAIWFGHSTFLLNMKGKAILVDPILSSYAAPFSFMVKRFQDPVVKPEELPSIDFIVISHDHYDHLDMPTVKFFKDKNTKFIVPIGVGVHLVGWGIDKSRITELDWWNSTTLDGVEFIATPAQHFSGRTFGKRNETLWAGWVIKNDTQNVFYSGDSGYDTHFVEIGNKYGPFDIAFVEDGQYDKQWEEVHLLPEQSVQAFYDLKARAYFPVHWGSFNLSRHPWYEPITKIYQAANEKGFKIFTPKIGEPIEVGPEYKATDWWSALID